MSTAIKLDTAETIAETQPPLIATCPWASPTASNIVDFNDIMSEQLACSLRVEEEEQIVKDILIGEGADVASGIDLSSLKNISSPTDDCNSDMLIAPMLQMQFNKEFDENLKRVEQKYNGASKVSVSLSNYMASANDVDSDSDEDLDLPPPKNWDNFEAHEKAFPAMPKCGYVKINNELFTKHDVTMSGRRNACRVMEDFPPCIHTGDGASFDMQLSNKVFNSLKVYSKSEEGRRNRLHDKTEKSTSDMAIDPKTRLLIYKMINNAVLEKVFGIISTGKEAIVLYANGGKYNAESETENAVKIPEECAIKVFKTTLNEFKSRDRYIKDDYRFKDRFSKQNPRKFVHLWAEKEMHNLSRMAKGGIPCPAVVQLKKHILVLEFIGKDMKPAPKLKEVKFSLEESDALLISAYEQTVNNMTKLYQECKLVHGDLSEYNILWHEDTTYFIDVSQSVEPSHPHALEFLHQDCTNIINFFEKKKLRDIHTAESLFTHITGYELNGSEADILNQILNYEKNCELLTFAQPEKPFAFDYCWEKSKTEEK